MCFCFRNIFDTRNTQISHIVILFVLNLQTTRRITSNVLRFLIVNSKKVKILNG